jgi:RNA polymerase sigma-70 factor (family 1)
VGKIPGLSFNDYTGIVYFKFRPMSNSNFLLIPTSVLVHFRQGDESALKFIYDRYFRFLCLIVREYVGQQDVAEDIVTNAFIKLHNSRAGIKDGGHVYRFLFVAARNEAVDHYRRKRRHHAAREAYEQLVDKEYLDPREDELEKEQWLLKIQHLIEQLPPARKQIFQLHFFEGHSIREIANHLKLTETTVRNQRNRALIFLRQAFFL